MKKNLTLSLLFLGAISLFASQPEASPKEKKTLFDRIFSKPVRKDWMNITLHTKGSANAYFQSHEFEKAGFNMDQLRVDVRGEVLPGLSYRYQQRLTHLVNSGQPKTDNLPASIDYAMLAYRFNPHFRIQAGKMCTAFGGFEFDANPIEIYQYSNMTMHTIGFLTGIDFGFYINPDQEFRLQIVNSRNDSFQDTYGKTPDWIKPAKADFLYTFNWNGKMGARKNFLTRWSASYLNQAKGEHLYMVMLGTAIKEKKWGTYVDLIYSNEDIDRKRIISNMVAPISERANLMNTQYFSVIHHMNFRVKPKWNLFVKNTYDQAFLENDNEFLKKGVLQRIWSYEAGVEYYPFANEDLHINLSYTGRKYFNNQQLNQLQVNQLNPSKLELSFIWAMRIL